MSTQRILITGTSRGLGQALVLHYLARGATVFGCARGPAAVTHTQYTHLCADVTDEGAIKDVARAVRDTAGGLDVLINNAGVAGMNPIALTTLDAARRMLDTNLLGTFLFTRTAIRLMRGTRSARIVNVSSVAVPLRLEGEALYAAAKSAVETFTRITAREVAPYGITCNAVGPSPVRTALTDKIPRDKLDQLMQRQAIPRWAEPADVINVVDFFLKPESALVTGQIVYLGGVG